MRIFGKVCIRTHCVHTQRSRLARAALGLGFAVLGLLPLAAAAQPSLGTTALLEGPGAGIDSVVLAATGAWTATANAAWLHLDTANQNGTGSTNVVFSYDANPGATRAGTLTIAGQTLTVTQAGSTYIAVPLTTLVASGLNQPHGVAVDGSGDVYITDTYNQAIKEWTAANDTVTTPVSSGLLEPFGVAVDGAGNLYIADTWSNAIKVWTAASNTVSTLVASGLNHPGGVAMDGAGNVYFADTGNNVIKEWVAASNTVTTLVGSGLNSPSGVTVDGAGNVYIADTGNNAIKKWTASNNTVTSLVASGLYQPTGVAVDGAGNVYIADYGNNAVKKWAAANNTLAILVGSGLWEPYGVAVDGAGNLYIADTGNGAIKELPHAFVDATAKWEASVAGGDVLPAVLPATANLLAPFAPSSDQAWLTITGITNGVVSFAFSATTSNRTANITLLGQPITVTQFGPPLGTSTLLEGPSAGSDSVVLALPAPVCPWTATANDGWLHLSAANQSGTGSTNVVFSYDANLGATRTGTVTIAGQTLSVTQAGSTYVAIPSLATTLVSVGQLTNATGLAVDSAGNVYIANTSGTQIDKWTMAGNGWSPIIMGLNHPTGVAIGGAGDLYIAETGNNAVMRWVTTLVSSGLSAPQGVAADGAGNVYIADTGNDAIKEWTATNNTVTTLVGTGLYQPRGVAVDAAGNVYIVDTGNSDVTKWTRANDTVTTLGVSGLSQPRGVAVDGAGNVYITDTGNRVIKKWTAANNTVTTLAAGWSGFWGIAVDGAGNLYAANAIEGTIREWPHAFVDPTAKWEGPGAGSDVLPVVLPATANLRAPFAPTSDQTWLTITGTANGVVSFAFSALTGTTNRTAHIALLGKSISITQLAVINQEPVSTTVCAGSPAIFSVTATGENLAYLWQVSQDGAHSFTNVSSTATNASYTNLDTTLAESGFQYRVIVSASVGTATSTPPAVLTVQAPPAITLEPTNLTICAGSPAVFSVGTTGQGPAYQWQVSQDGGTTFTNISETATNASYTNLAAALHDNGSRYQVVVSGTCGPSQTSAPPSVLTVNAPATASAGGNQTVFCSGGATAALGGIVGGGATGGVWSSSGTGFFTPDATTLNATYAPSTGDNAAGTVTLTLASTGQSAPCPAATAQVVVTIQAPPVITAQPASQTNSLGSPAIFSVTATGTGLTYQWQVSRDGGTTFTNISTSATNVSYTNVAPALDDNGNQYQVIVSGVCPPPATSSPPAVLTVNPVTQPVCAVPPVGLISWWRGEGDASDSAGANNGTLQGGATFTVGEVGQAFSFNPVNGTVIVPDSSSLRLTNQLTIEAWINTRSTNADHGIVSKVGGVAGNNGYEFALSGNKLVGQFNSPGQGWPSSRIMCALPLATGVWHHVAWTYDQSAMKLYFNGQPVATNVIGAQSIMASNSTLRISGDDGNHVYFDGLIDEPALYNRALSASEIQDIYNAGSEGKCTSVTTVPAHLTVCAGSPAVFSVGAMGGGLSYQWRVSRDNGTTFTNISDTATNASYTNPAPTLADSGNAYQAIVTWGGGAFTSAPPSVLSVNAPATASAGGDQTIYCSGSATTALGGTVGGAATGGTWSSSGTGSFSPDPTTLDATYTPSAGDNAAGTVTLTLASTGQLTPCPAATAQVVVTIQAPPAITGQPASRTNCPGSPASFSVTASGAGLNYQWQTSGDNGVTFTNISDTATNASYTNEAPTWADDGRQYQVILNGTCTPPVTSAPPAVLTMHSCSATTLGPVTSPQNYGNVQLTAIVSPPDALGTVTFEEGSAVLGTGTLDGVTGIAVCTPIGNLLTVPASPHSIYAVYSGDDVYAPSVSASSNLTISPLPLVVSGTMTYNGAAMAPAASLGVNNNLDGTNLTLGGCAVLDGRDVGSHAVVSSTAATPARRQFATGTVGSSAATSFTVTLPLAPMNGNTLVAVISTRGTALSQVSSIAEDNVVTWKRAVQAANTNGTTTEIWYAPIGVTNAGAMVTINLASSLYSAAVVLEHNGVLTASPSDRMASATGYGAAAVTGTTVTTAQANEVWVGGIGFTNSGYTLGTLLNGFTSPVNAASGSGTATNDAKVYALEYLAAATGNASSGGTISTASYWSGAIATFLPTPSLTLTGSAAANYTAAGLSGTVTVSPVAVTVTPTMDNKVYDGTTNSTQIPSFSPWLGSGDSFAALVQAFTDRNVGTASKTLVLVPPTIAISDGNFGVNYSGISYGTFTTATITPKGLTSSSGLSAVSRQYDGTTIVAITGTPALPAAEAPGTGTTSDGKPYTVDSVSASTTSTQGNVPAKYVGVYYGTVTFPGLTLTGTGNGNYTVSYTGAGSATITPALVQLAKTYDGTTSAAASQLAVVNNFDGANVTLSGSATLAGRNVGSQGLVTSSYAAPIRLQAATGRVGLSHGGITTYGISLSSLPANGNTLVAVIASRRSTGNYITRINQPASVSGLPAVTWTKVVEAVQASSSVSSEIWYATNVFYAGQALTVTMSTSSFSAGVVAEYSGVLLTSAVDGTGTAKGANTASVVTGYATPTTQPTDLLVGSIGLQNGSYTMAVSQGTNTYTVNIIGHATSTYGSQSQNANVYALDCVPTTLGTYQLGGTQTAGVGTSSNWVGCIAAFKAQPLSGLTLGGSPLANNYTLYSTTTVAVAPTNLTVTAAANIKTYDGTTNATAAPMITIGSIQTGDSAPAWTETYNSKHVGTGKTLSPAHLVVSDGNGGSNYSYTFVSAATGEIDKTNLTVTATTNTKPYDGTTSALTHASLTAGNIQPGDSPPAFWPETYADANVGANKTLIPAGLVSDGNGGANYSYTYVPDYSGVISGFEIAVPGGQPANQASCLGSPATFCVTALEQPALGLSYQWQVSGDGGITFTNISDSATNACYTNVSPTLDQSGYQYQVIITQTGGASLTSSPPAVLIVGAAATASAGGNQTICSGSSTAALEGTVGGVATGGLWTSSGTGTFLPDATTVNATYTPSADDNAAGTVTLTLTSTGEQPPCVAATAEVVVTIHPTATASTSGNQTICAGSSTAALGGSVGGGATGGLWTSTGTGTFLPDATTLNATYSPSPTDIAAGTVTLTLSSTGQQVPCSPATARVIVAINRAATVSAGTNQTVCSGSSTAALGGAVGGGATGGLWTSSGSGTFAPNATTLDATYSPSAADITAGTVTLTLTSTGQPAPCGPGTVQVVISMRAPATASAGANQTICGGSSTAALGGSVGGGATGGLWTSSGTGTFAPDTTTLSATYSPSAGDIAVGTVTLTLTSTGQQVPCNPATAQVVLTIRKAPTVTTGGDQAICAGNATVSLGGTVGGGATGGRWTSSGTGTFVPNAATLNATYSPSAADITAGTITLTLSSTGQQAPCSAATAQVVVSIPVAATASAGARQTVCSGSSTTGLGGTVGGGANGGLWTSSGTGTFLPDATTLNAFYTPSASDTTAGTVTLTLTSTGQPAPCLPGTAQVVVGILDQAALGASALFEGRGGDSDSVVLAVKPASGTWTATANAPWLHLSEADQMSTGSTNVVFNYDANPGTTRTGTLTIACQTLTVTQAGSNYVAAPAPVTALVASGLSNPHGVAVDSAGNVYIADTGNNAIKEWRTVSNTVTTLVASGLSSPMGVAVDGAGNLYIADTGNSAIKKWTAANNTVTTLVDAGLNQPRGVAVDGAGNVYIADTSNNAIKEWTTSNNTLTTLIASGLNQPRGVAVDVAGNVYIADAYDNALKVWTAANGALATLYDWGLNLPSGVAVDGAGNVYIADASNNVIQEWITAFPTPTTLAAWGLSNPSGVAVDAIGNVYIADTANNAVKELPRAFVDPTTKFEGPDAGTDVLPVLLRATANLRAPFAPTSDRAWLTVTGITNGVVSFAFSANTGSSNRTALITLLGQIIPITQFGPPSLGTTALLEGPGTGSDSVVLVAYQTTAWTATANAGWLHVSAANLSGTGSTNVVFSYDANPSATRTGTLTIGGQTLTVTQAGSTYIAAPGPMTALVASGLSNPYGVAVDGAGNVYITDSGHSALKKWTAASNTVTTLVASGLNNPLGVAVDGAGNVYIADQRNSAIKEWSAANHTVTTLVGWELDHPGGVAVDGAGDVYIGGGWNWTIKKWTAANSIVTTLIASGLRYPMGVTVDGAGNVYTACAGDGEITKWTAANNTVTKLVTSGLFDPNGVAVDGAGNVYISDRNNNAIKKWTPVNSTVTTLVSTGLSYPEAVAVDGAGNLYIADSLNNAVKELPYAFVDPTAKTEGPGAGSDALPVVLPATANLRAPFTPTSDQEWLTITGVTNAVVSFAFEANTGSTSRTANITLLGQPIAITQTVLAPPMLIGPMLLEDGTFQLSFSNNDPGVSFTVLTTTNPSLPLADWTVAGPATNIAPGLFQFSTTSTNNPQGYYRVRSP
jgi:DNA-binding beta-propeller fold protein YncE